MQVKTRIQAITIEEKVKFRDFVNCLLACMILNATVLLPIILSAPLYLDDYGRAINGTFGWKYDARPATDILFFTLSGGSRLVAASPFYQILSLILISIACALAAQTYQIRSRWLAAMATLPMMAQPYYLANLSFGFDSASMSLAQLLAISASILIVRLGSMVSLLASFACLTMSLFLYQASASSYLVFGTLLILACAIGITPNQCTSSLIRVFGRFIGCYLLAMAIAACYVRFAWNSRSEYASAASKLLEPSHTFFPSLVNHATKYLKTYMHDWATSPLLPTVALIAIIVIALQLRKPKQAILISSAYIVTLIAAPGASLLLASPQDQLPRTLVFIGPLLASFSLHLTSSLARLQPKWLPTTSLGLLPLGVLAWVMVSFAYSYGHAMRAQEEFTQNYVNRLITSASSLTTPGTQLSQLRGISYTGGIPRSLVLQNSTKKFPLIDRLVVRLVANNNDIGALIMAYHGLPLLKPIEPMPVDLTAASCTQSKIPTLCSSDSIVQIKDGILRIRFIST